MVKAVGAGLLLALAGCPSVSLSDRFGCADGGCVASAATTRGASSSGVAAASSSGTGTGTTGGSSGSSGTTGAANCVSVSPEDQCPEGQIEVAGTLTDACDGLRPLQHAVQVVDAFNHELAVSSDSCGDFYTCVSPGTIVTALINVQGYLPVVLPSAAANAPIGGSSFLICDSLVQTLFSPLPLFNPSLAMVLAVLVVDGSEGACPGVAAGWELMLEAMDGGAVSHETAYATGTSFTPNLVTDAEGVVLFYNLDPTAQSARIVGIFDGGPVCDNQFAAPPMEYTGLIPLLPGTATFTPFIPRQSALQSGPPACITASRSAVVTTLAGEQVSGFADGLASTTQAAFDTLGRITADGRGSLYIADAINNAIRVLRDGGVTTLAGIGLSGFSDGPGGLTGTAELRTPLGLAPDQSGDVFFADAQNHAIRKIDAQGTVTTIAGNQVLGFTDGLGSAARFHHPGDVAVDLQGNLYVADTGNHAIRKIDPAGNVTTLAGNGNLGFVNGLGSAASFNFPLGVAVDDGGTVLVADSANNAIRRIDASGNVTTLAGTGDAGLVNGPGDVAELSSPVSVRLDGRGYAYVADLYNAAIRVIDPAGNVTTLAQPSVALNGFQGVAVDGAGTVYASAENVIVRFDDAGPTVFGQALDGFVDGQSGGRTALFGDPQGLALDDGGNLWIADTQKGAIRELDLAGNVTTLAAGLGPLTGIALDGHGGFYLATTTIQHVGRDGGVSTFASVPATGVAVDAAYNLYATTSSNLVLEIDAQGTVTTLAGDGDAGFNDGDGGGIFDRPLALAVDSECNVFVADTGNQAIRKIDPLGNVTTVAGNGKAGFVDGAGGRLGIAQLDGPRGIAVDSAGDLYVSDTGNASVRRIDTAGNVTTLAGATGSGVLDGPAGCAGVAEIGTPAGIVVDPLGHLFFTDGPLIREISQ